MHRIGLFMVGLSQSILLVIIQQDVVVAVEFVTVATVVSKNVVNRHVASAAAAKNGHQVWDICGKLSMQVLK